MNSRDAALQRLERFLDRVPSYKHTRNYDRPGHEGVSQLSHWIRYRVVTEEECVKAVLHRHSFEAAEKYLQEVLWRTYWKGWLEMHPQVWHRYCEESPLLEEHYRDHERYKDATAGKTALSFFNEWVAELIETGYLHNHTRMWFASVWIFTLQLPWQLGAAFMYHHLKDADPASNTLSWRWVGGLQTQGKIYAARPDNIATYSDKRWSPRASDLILDPKPLPADPPGERVPLMTVAGTPPPRGALALLHDDDLSADLSESFSPHALHYCVLERSESHQSESVQHFRSALRADAASRSGARVVCSAGEIASLAHETGVAEVHSMLPRIGFERASLLQLAGELQHYGVSIVWHRRTWDSHYMPLARSGFFTFWETARRQLRN